MTFTILRLGYETYFRELDEKRRVWVFDTLKRTVGILSPAAETSKNIHRNEWHNYYYRSKPIGPARSNNTRKHDRDFWIDGKTVLNSTGSISSFVWLTWNAFDNVITCLGLNHYRLFINIIITCVCVYLLFFTVKTCL